MSILEGTKPDGIGDQKMNVDKAQLQAFGETQAGAKVEIEKAKKTLDVKDLKDKPGRRKFFTTLFGMSLMLLAGYILDPASVTSVVSGIGGALAAFIAGNGLEHHIKGKN